MILENTIIYICLPKIKLVFLYSKMFIETVLLYKEYAVENLIMTPVIIEIFRQIYNKTAATHYDIFAIFK